MRPTCPMWAVLALSILVQAMATLVRAQGPESSAPSSPGMATVERKETSAASSHDISIGALSSEQLRSLFPSVNFRSRPGPQAGDTVASQLGWLTLEEVLKSVTSSYPLLLAAEQEGALAEAEVLGARGAFDTTFRASSLFDPTGRYIHRRYDAVLEQPTTFWGSSFYSGYRLGTGNFASYDGRQATLSDGEWRSGFRLPLWRNGPTDRRRANLQIAELGPAVAGASIELQRLGFVRSATRRYWEWVASGNRYRVVKSLLEIAEMRNDAIAESVRLGQLPPIELTDNARAVLERRSQLVSAQRFLQQASIDLSLFYRDRTGNPVIPDAGQLPPAFPEPVHLADDRVRKDSELAFARRPELRRLTAQLAQSRVERRLAANQRQPAIDLVFGFSQDMGSGSSTISPKEAEGGFVFELPLQRRVATGKMLAEDARLERLARQEQFARDRISAEIQDSVSALRAAYQRLGLIREELKAARELEAAERTKFELGDSTLFLVNLRELATADAAIREVLALMDYHSSLADYRAAIAEP